MAKCWIVTGSTGQYSDRTEWPVRVFLQEKSAIDFFDKLDRAYLSFPQTKRGYERDEGQMEELEKCMKELDPRFMEDYTGTTYFLDVVELDNG